MTDATSTSALTAAKTFTTTHASVEFELAAAYYDGILMGIRLAAEAYGRIIDTALRRPEGHGGPDLDVATRVIVRDLYGRYLGVPKVSP